MATIKDLTAMCKSSKMERAFDIALADYDCAPGNVWTQRDDGVRHSFIPPALAERMHLEHGAKAHALIVYDYNRKKEEWNWVCVTLEKLH